MVLNYHELTMNEPRDSLARRQQYLVICSIMFSIFLYSLYISGILLTIEPVERSFSGGSFCYKFISRDYVASIGLGKRIRTDVYDGISAAAVTTNNEDKKEKRRLIEDRVYSVFLDNPEVIGGSFTRFLSGFLVAPDSSEKTKYCDPLFAMNSRIEKEALLHKSVLNADKAASDLFQQTVYEHVNLPKVNSLAITFPFTGGFLSGLVLSYKIIPQMRILAEERGESGNVAVVISQCSEREGTCTHYVPLSQGKDFLVGNPTMEEHLELIGDANNEIWEALKKIYPFTKKAPEIEEGEKSGEEL